jgi:acylphosphatase
LGSAFKQFIHPSAAERNVMGWIWSNVNIEINVAVKAMLHCHFLKETKRNLRLYNWKNNTAVEPD